MIEEKGKIWNYYHGVNIYCNLFNYIFHKCVAWLPYKQSQTPNVNDQLELLLVDASAYFMSQLDVLMTLNYTKIHCPLQDLWLPKNRTCSALLLFVSRACLFVFVVS